MNLFKKYLMFVESNNKKVLTESNQNNINNNFDVIIKEIQEINLDDIKKSASFINYHAQEIFDYLMDDFKSDDIFKEKYFDDFNRDISSVLELIENKIKTMPFLEKDLLKIIKNILDMYFKLFKFFLDILRKGNYNSYLMKELYETYGNKKMNIISSLSEHPHKFKVNVFFQKYDISKYTELAGLSISFAMNYSNARKGKETEEEEIENINYQRYIDDMDEDILRNFDKSYDEISTEIDNYIKEIEESIGSDLFSDKNLFLTSKDKKKKIEVNSAFNEIVTYLEETLDLFSELVLRIETSRSDEPMDPSEAEMKQEKNKIQSIINKLLFILKEKAFFSNGSMKIKEIISDFNLVQTDSKFEFKI